MTHNRIGPMDFVDALKMLKEDPERRMQQVVYNGVFRLLGDILQFQWNECWKPVTGSINDYLHKEWYVIEPLHTAVEAVIAYREGKEVKSPVTLKWYHRTEPNCSPFTAEAILRDDWMIRER